MGEFVFLLSARDSHGVALCLIDVYGVFVIDIYSCDHPWLVREIAKHRGSVIEHEHEPEIGVSKKIFPAPKVCDRFRCELLGVSFRFVSPFVTRRVSYFFQSKSNYISA